MPPKKDPNAPKQPRKKPAPKCQDGRARSVPFGLLKNCITPKMVKKMDEAVAKVFIKENAKKRAVYNKANPKPRKKKVKA